MLVPRQKDLVEIFSWCNTELMATFEPLHPTNQITTNTCQFENQLISIK